MKTVLVTGGAGFIGSHLVDTLVERGASVRVLDNLSTGKIENLAASRKRIRFVEGDINDPDAMNPLLQDADVVFHQAALPSVPRSVEDPLNSHRHIATGTLQVLNLARLNHVKRVVFASSSSIYGGNPTLPKHEGLDPAPISPYAIMKYSGEMYARFFRDHFKLATVGLRYFNVFGPRQDPNSQYSAVIPKFITALLNGVAPTIYGDGEQSRDFTFVANVVEANLLAAACPDPKEYVYNVACGARYSLNRLFETLRALCHSDLKPVYAPARAADIRHSHADIARAQRDLGFKPRVGFEEGLKLTVAAYRLGN